MEEFAYTASSEGEEISSFDAKDSWTAVVVSDIWSTEMASDPPKSLANKALR